MATIDARDSVLLGSVLPSFPSSIGYRSLSFKPLFRIISSRTTSNGSTIVQGKGVDFDLETGQVTALPVPQGQRRMRNFLVMAELEVVKLIMDNKEMPIEDDNSVPGSIPVGGETTGSGSGSGSSGSGTGSTTSTTLKAQAHIRVHVHDRIESWWPTPAKLRIASGSPGAAPRLLAKFDDGVVADITEWPLEIDGLTITWTSTDSTRVQVDANTGRLRSSSSPSTPTRYVDVYATMTHVSVPIGVPRSAVVRAHVIPAWSEPRPARFVAGPGKQSYESATNILFLADGFVAGEEARFNELVARIAETSVTREDLQPFKLLRGSINYWSLFLPSEESGTTLLSEQQGSQAGTPFKLDDVPDAKLVSTHNPRTLGQMIFHLGLPVVADFISGESDNAAFGRIMSALAVDFDLPNPFNVDLNLFREWRSLSERSLVESRDTVFAVQAARRPFVGRDPEGSPSMDDHRISTDDIMALVGALYADDRSGGGLRRLPVGHVWNRPSAGPHGKDAGLICVLSRSAAFGAVTVADENSKAKYVLARLWRYNGTEHEFATRPSGSPTFVLSPTDVNPLHGASPSVVLPLVHELGHVFGLVDEYGGNRPKMPVTSPGYPNGQWRYELFPRTGDHPGQYDPTMSFPTTKRIVPSKIRWAAWPRLRAAGELAAKPQITGTQVRVMLRPEHVRDFAEGQRVCLRSRSLIGSDYQKSVSMMIVSKAGNELILDPAMPFAVADADRYDVVPGVLPPLLILPLRLPGSGLPGTREQPLVAPEIQLHIGISGGALNAESNDPLWPCTKATTPVAVQFPTNLPTALTKTPAMTGAMFRWPNIVGLYQGGLGVDCGAYHPAGDCMMRGVVDAQGSDQSSAMETTEFRPFCHVCRYWLVDRIDPSQHRALDDLYDPNYPGPRPYE